MVNGEIQRQDRVKRESERGEFRWRVGWKGKRQYVRVRSTENVLCMHGESVSAHAEPNESQLQHTHFYHRHTFVCADTCKWCVRIRACGVQHTSLRHSFRARLQTRNQLLRGDSKDLQPVVPPAKGEHRGPSHFQARLRARKRTPYLRLRLRSNYSRSVRL